MEIPPTRLSQEGLDLSWEQGCGIFGGCMGSKGGLMDEIDTHLHGRDKSVEQLPAGGGAAGGACGSKLDAVVVTVVGATKYRSPLWGGEINSITRICEQGVLGERHRLIFLVSHQSHPIRNTDPEGRVEFVLSWTDPGYGMVIQTTGRNLAETNAIALHLVEKFGQ